MIVFRPSITKIAFEGKMFIVHVTMSEVRRFFLVSIYSFVAFSGSFISCVAYCVTVYFIAMIQSRHDWLLEKPCLFLHVPEFLVEIHMCEVFVENILGQ